ncbi:MAG TPA: carbon-nitrogen hydrolase family protein [Nitrospira sp.]|nr:carbon-nitrogen hydrolase family protein [Nitrospira sp.]
MRAGRIGLLHLSIAPGDIRRNQYLIVEAVQAASAMGAQWIVTPELAVSGLQFAHTIGTDWIEPQPDPWMKRVCHLVKTLRRTVFLSCPEREGRRCYNSVFVINSDGEIVGRHRKINVASDSLSWSSPGDGSAPVKCDGINVGLLICSDLYTSNHASMLKSRGAQMFISPASWGPGIHGPNGEWEARTKETGLPLFVCNRTGAEKTLNFANASSLVVQHGTRMLSHASECSAVLIFDWDFSAMTALSTAYHAAYLKE